MSQNPSSPTAEKPKPSAETAPNQPSAEQIAPKRPDPTRYQDWEKGGRCIDF
jgi:hypothetical protein